MADKTQQGDRGRAWLASVLHLGGLKAEIETAEIDDELWMTIEPEASQKAAIAAALCDKSEHALDALQYLANVTLNFDVDRDLQCSYTLEIDDYRKTRNAELEALVTSAIERVKEVGEAVELTGLTSAERRAVHHLLQDHPELTNRSYGQEPHRKLVIELVSAASAKPKPKSPSPASDPTP